MLIIPVLAPTSSAILGIEDRPPGAVAKKLVSISNLLYFHKTIPEIKEKEIDKSSIMIIVTQFSWKMYKTDIFIFWPSSIPKIHCPNI